MYVALSAGEGRPTKFLGKFPGKFPPQLPHFRSKPQACCCEFLMERYLLVSK